MSKSVGVITMARARTLSGGKRIWMKSVEKFLRKNLGYSFTAKEIIQNATLVTKTYNTSFTGDRVKYNGRYTSEDKTHILLVDAKMCPTPNQLAQSLRGHKQIDRMLEIQITGPPLMEYYWRYEDEE